MTSPSVSGFSSSDIRSPNSVSLSGSQTITSSHHRHSSTSTQVPWLEKVRESFDEVDCSGTGLITLSQFRDSHLRFLIADTVLSPERMEDCFRQIDADSDNLISWSQLVDYLLCIQRSLTGSTLEKTLELSFVAPSEVIMKKHHRSSVCLRTSFIPALGQIVALSETQMVFYNIGECIPVQTFHDHDNFVDYTYMPCIYKIALAKQNRQVVFYDLRTHTKHPFVISATVQAADVPKMDLQTARLASKKCHRRVIPLFNAPRSICSVSDEPTLFIGDEVGAIEVFTMIISKEEKAAWSSRWDGIVQMHDGPVVQISYYATLGKYISASADGSFCLWRYDVKTRALNKEYKFVDPDGLSPRSFVYDIRTRDLIYTTSAHVFGLWRINTEHHQAIELDSQVISTLEIYQVKEASYLLIFSKSNIISVFRMPGLEGCGSWYLGMQHDLCPPTGCVIMNDYCYLLGAFMSCWKLENSTGSGEHPHTYKIVTAISNDIFNSVISLDTHGEVCNWDMGQGTKNYSYSLYEIGTEVTCAALDIAQRRLAVGYKDGRCKIVSAISGSELSQIDRKSIEGGCIWLEFTVIFGQKKILVCTGSKTLVLFDDLYGNRTRFVRSFIGHTEDLSMATVINGHFIVSVGAEHELFLWSLTNAGPVIRYSLPNEPTMARQLGPNSECFIVGDIAGMIHFMSRTQATPCRTIDAFEMSIKSPITRITIYEAENFLVISNLHGYVKYWRLQSSEIEAIRTFRAHEDPVIGVSISTQHGLVVTASDENVRLWSIEPFGMIGAFGAGRLWQSTEHSTWLRDCGFDPEPVHFAKPEPVQVDAVQEAPVHIDGDDDDSGGDDGGDEVTVKLTTTKREKEIPRLSIESVESAMADMQGVVERGREILEKQKGRADKLRYPLTTRPMRRRNILDDLNRPPIYGISAIAKVSFFNTMPLPKIVKPKAGVGL